MYLSSFLYNPDALNLKSVQAFVSTISNHNYSFE